MKIICTVEKILSMSKWYEVCGMKGIREDAVEKGFVKQNTEITFTEKEAAELGFKISLKEE